MSKKHLNPKEVEELRKFAEELAREIEEMKRSRGVFDEAFVNYVEKAFLEGRGELKPQQVGGESRFDQATERKQLIP